MIARQTKETDDRSMTVTDEVLPKHELLERCGALLSDGLRLPLYRGDLTQSLGFKYQT